MDDIAVVGLGLRFPGNAACPEELWKVLERGESQWAEFPKDRLNIDGYYHPGGDRQGSISFRGAHFLKDDVAAFDAPFFSVSAEDAKAIDPQQRILLEASFEALENAGIRKEDIDGSDAAVYVGSFVKDYEQVCLRDPDWQPQYAATGNGIAIMANRISYFFNLHGPSMTIDTGCSGSLVSIHLAAQSLRAGETSLAIAAGAGMILTPNTIMPMTALNFLSPDGKCFTFDARANGYGRGEGIGVVVMKRLADAIRDNDTIRAVIRATRVNQDGHTTGITLPSKEAQVANIRSIYESAGLDFNQTAYVECHGTGTQAGDWRELKAISESLGSVRPPENPIIVGSLKPNIGHLEGAAGVAGLIKGVLVLERGKIPPNINFETGNPDIDFHEWKVKVPRQLTNWPLPGLRRVSVNCFGFGGTNAHVIMDEAPVYMSDRGLTGNHNSSQSELDANSSHHTSTEGTVSEPQIFCYSSHERSGVQRVVNSHVSYLESAPSHSNFTLLQDYSYTLNCRRSQMEWKHAIIAISSEELVEKIRTCDEATFQRSSKGKTRNICFIFCGQGAQYAQMGKDLLSFRPFRLSLEAATLYMKTEMSSSFDLLEEILKESNESQISRPEICQPATTALQVALVDLFRSFNVTPNYVIGHSSGEVAAAYAAGKISREAAWMVSYYRGLVSSRVYLNTPDLKGAMIVVGMALDEAESLLQSKGYDAEIACINSPRSITISGGAGAVAQISHDLSEIQVFNRILPVKTAYHSRHMNAVAGQYNAMLQHIAAPGAGKAVMFSSVSGRSVSTLGSDYWVKNMVSRVQYVEAIESMMSTPSKDLPDMVIEISPSAALKSPTLDTLSSIKSEKLPAYCSVLNRHENGAVSLLKVVGELWLHGCPINMKNVVSKGCSEMRLKSLADLPPYPWNHAKSYWHESHLGRANRFREFGRQDLIGAPSADATSFEPRWRGFLRISENPWIQDHQVQKTIVYPAAGMITMALEGATQLIKDKSDLLGYEITRMRVEKAMMVPNTTHGLETALNFKTNPRSAGSPDDKLSFEFSIYSKQLDGLWERHATGVLHMWYKRGDWKAMFPSVHRRYKSLLKSCDQSMIPRQLYELLDIVGMNYGPLFQNIYQIAKGDNACVGKVRIPDTKAKMPAKFEFPHLIHPATLDAMFQTPFAIDNAPMVPTYIESVFISASISRDIDQPFAGYATATRAGILDADADIVMTQSDWVLPSVVIRGLHFTGLSNSPSGLEAFLPNHRHLCTETVWAEDVSTASPESLKGLLIILAHKYPGLSVLQVGQHDQLAKSILDIFIPKTTETPWISRYTVSPNHQDYSAASLLGHVQGTALESLVETRAIDGSEELPEYNLILVCDAQDVSITGLKKHLKTGGLLVMPNCAPDFCQNGDSTVHEHAVRNSEDLIQFIYQQKRPIHSSWISQEFIILLPNCITPQLIDLASNLWDIIEARKPGALITRLHVNEVHEILPVIGERIVISLLDCSIDEDEPTSVFTWTQDEFQVFHALQKSARGIMWVTRGAHMNPVNARAAPIIALARTLISEDPLKKIATLDLSNDTPLSDLKAALSIISVLDKTLTSSQDSTIRDMEYAEEGGKLFVPRLIPIHSLNGLIENNVQTDVLIKPFHTTEHRLKLNDAQQGIHGSNGLFSVAAGSGPTPKEVELIFESATVTHIDLEALSEHTTGAGLGTDVIGHIGRIGDDVTSFSEGERVVAIVTDGAFQNRRNIGTRFVKRWTSPLPLSHYVSAFYALRHVARLRQNRSVLIHAGATSLGMAAIRIASELGAEIFATVMGPDAPSQRLALKTAGLGDEQILEADSDSFVKVIQDLTGKGVDVVYNPTQRHIEANFSCVRRGGYVVQFASKSPAPPSVPLASPTTSFFSLDLHQVLQDDPDYVAELLDEAIQFATKSQTGFPIDASLIRTVELSELQDAFKNVESSPYLGLVSITAAPDSDVKVKVAAPKAAKAVKDSLDPDATYLLAGGLGGLGRSICDLLVNNGAQHIAFISRSGASTDSSIEFIEGLKKRGVDVQVYCVDICNTEALRTVVEERIRVELPPVKGVFQCAAVIKDAVFDNMGYSDWVTAFKPKTVGTENLVNMIPSADCDPFFIFLASSAGVIGNRGQANYAAGNCYLDALARKLRLQGKHAVSIDLGPVLGAGMLADDDEILDMLRASGFYGIRHQDFLTTIKHAITMEITPSIPMPPQVTMGVGTGGLIRQNKPADPYWSRTALYGYLNLVDMPIDLSVGSISRSIDMKSMLGSCPDATAAKDIVCTGLCHMLAKAMNMLPEEIDSGKPPNVYGVDSLVAVGVRNWVFTNCGVEVSVFEVLSDKTIEELAKEIALKGGYGVEKD